MLDQRLSADDGISWYLPLVSTYGRTYTRSRDSVREGEGVGEKLSTLVQMIDIAAKDHGCCRATGTYSVDFDETRVCRIDRSKSPSHP